MTKAARQIKIIKGNMILVKVMANLKAPEAIKASPGAIRRTRI